MIANRDKDIRKALHATELQPYILDPNSLVLDEFTLSEEDTRIDIAVVNGSFHGYEIKSDADSLERLPKQSESYGRIFDYLWIACGPRFLGKIKNSIPEYWGILLAETTVNETKLLKLRDAKDNPNISPISVAGLLWKDEAINLLSEFGIDKGFKSKPRKVISKHLAETIPYSELAPRIRATIRNRSNWRVDSLQTRYADLRRSGPRSRNFREKNLQQFLSRISVDLHS